MLLPAEQRRLLGAFLRSQRERLSPEAAGLRFAGTVRRRTPGLRREEVAELCGLSATWYSWIEQGRDISVSTPALARLADALRLESAERAYLFELAGARDPGAGRRAGRDRQVAAPWRRIVASIADPAYVLDGAWRPLAWNAGALSLFADWLGTEPPPSLLAFVFQYPAARRFIPDWADRARRLTAEVRADLGHRPGDPDLRGLVDDLCASCTDFATRWNDHAVLGREGGERRFRDPAGIVLRYDQVTLVPAGAPDLKLVMLLRPAESDQDPEIPER